MKNTRQQKRRVLAMLLSLVLCVCLGASFAVPAQAAPLSGHWESVTVEDVDGHALVLDSRLTGVTAFDLAMDVEMKANTRCENWDVWVRSSRSGSFEKVGSIYLSGGNGYASKTIRLSSAMNVDAVIVTPTIPGGYSWSLSLDISNPAYSSNSQNNSSSKIGSSWTGSSSKSTGSYLSGDWEDVSIDGYDVGAFVLDSRLTNVSAFDLYLDMSPKAGAKCENWNVWARKSRSGSFEKVGYVYLDGGSGEVNKTIRLSSSMNIDAIAITPNINGRFSWTFYMGISNPSYSSNSSYSGGYLDADWEEVTINDNGRNYTNYALALATPLRNCRSIDLSVEINMKANASCKNWNIWVRSNGAFYKVDTLYLPAGSGSAEHTVYLNPARTIDAVAILPTASGGYSWNISLGISNPRT